MKKVTTFCVIVEEQKGFARKHQMDFIRLRNESTLTMLSVENPQRVSIGPNIFVGVDVSECPTHQPLT